MKQGFSAEICEFFSVNKVADHDIPTGGSNEHVTSVLPNKPILLPFPWTEAIIYIYISSMSSYWTEATCLCSRRQKTRQLASVEGDIRRGKHVQCTKDSSSFCWFFFLILERRRTLPVYQRFFFLLLILLPFSRTEANTSSVPKILLPSAGKRTSLFQSYWEVSSFRFVSTHSLFLVVVSISSARAYHDIPFPIFLFFIKIRFLHPRKS